MLGKLKKKKTKRRKDVQDGRTQTETLLRWSSSSFSIKRNGCELKKLLIVKQKHQNWISLPKFWVILAILPVSLFFDHSDILLHMVRSPPLHKDNSYSKVQRMYFKRLTFWEAKLGTHAITGASLKATHWLHIYRCLQKSNCSLFSLWECSNFGFPW